MTSAPVTHLLTTFLPKHIFNPIITRDFRPPKPDPAGILHIAREWGIVADQTAASASKESSGEPKAIPVIMVGDSIDDIIAGYRAGAATVLLRNKFNDDAVEHTYTDLVIDR